MRPLGGLEPEPPRRGEDPAECWCAARPDPADDPQAIWWDDAWQLRWGAEATLPVELVLSPRDHCDLPTVPLGLAARMGQLEAVIAAGVESLPSVARVQLAKYGDGGAHLHLFFFGRPAQMLQLRGSCLLLWGEAMPRVPEEVLRENSLNVARHVQGVLGGAVREG